MTNNNDKVIAVTGSAGYIGVHLVKILLEKGYRVRALVRDPQDENKVGFLRNLDKSEKKLLEFGGGDLEKADYKDLFQGCYSVIHVATPYVHTAPNPLEDIVKPAVNGTLRVLEAASQVSTIKKLIITSSAGAVINSLNPNLQAEDVYNDEHWNLDSTVENGPYFYSKVLAEQKAWEFHKENQKNANSNHFELSVINPGFIIGPSMTHNLNTSLKLVLRFMTEGAPIYPIRVGIVDVRDVALAHVLVLESSTSNNQRYLVINKVVQFKDLPLTAQKLFPQLQFNINPSLQETKVKSWTVNTTKIQSLGLTKFIDFETTLKDMIDKFIEYKQWNVTSNQ
ncbi:hypothetical protein DLAC_09754 [Tieghemostelium lacteum]|uniref:NAD-dependent epimerase/dehydratase domain-containing protein n=1 Tax=Tieghemostelium lacteum TaxID=361077 RepID=A0A151Z748_TIELA|nr:hypothetical protein DLAC_09754 [Tieghemostelium lacteum]|eukprot:KYQ89786.1 hypothetical protein DLAC_09754 [Tieghemostelium lacteum]